MATAGITHALRVHKGDHTNAWLDNEVIEATGCHESTAKNWRTGTVPPELGNLMLLVEAFGMTFLADVFSDQDKDGVLAERANIAADRESLATAAEAFSVRLRNTSPTDTDTVTDFPGAKEADE